MKIDDPKIRALQKKVRAACDEFNMAMACHEAWKPAAYDKALHERIGCSYAANTFLIVRQALRREMLLALMRLWGDNSKAVGMKCIANILQDNRVMDALTAECEAYWRGLPLPPGLEGTPEEQRAVDASNAELGRKESDDLRQRAMEATEIIGSYAEGGSRYATLKKLKTLRDEHLAHRQVTPTPVKADGANTIDEEIEAFYQDMSRLIQCLRFAVENTDSDPEETAKLRGRHAAFFWAGVRGERTEGLPNY
jgi:hypothetical protein